MEKFSRARRRVIQALILAVGGWPLWRYMTPETRVDKPVLQVAREAIPPDGALVFRQARVAVLRVDEEIYALSLTCTHLGCTVSVTPTELVCPCHGSTFSRTGEVLRGPATRSLERLAVRLEGDTVVVLS
jgi:cytochrome b6-f complex iron-sulfur subunit